MNEKAFMEKKDAYKSPLVHRNNNTVTITPGNTLKAYSACAHIWLVASIAAHSFIDERFWRKNKQAMKEQYLPASRVLVAYLHGAPVGFSAICGNRLGALFVLPSYWKNGIGKKLILQIFAEHDALSLTVYQKNQQAISFYQYMGFTVGEKQKCSHTGETELHMHWKKCG